MKIRLYPYQLDALQDILAENDIAKIPEADISEENNVKIVNIRGKKAQDAFYAVLFEAMCPCTF